VRALAPGGPTLRSIFRGPRGPPGPGAQRPSKKRPRAPLRARRPTPRLAQVHARRQLARRPGGFSCPRCRGAHHARSAPVNWHQRLAPREAGWPRRVHVYGLPPRRAHVRAPRQLASAPATRPHTRARRQLARRLWCESLVSRACLPNWHQRLRPVVSFLSFLPPREPPRPAVTESPPSPANWHRALRARQPSRRPLQSPRRPSTGAIARSSQARPGHRQPESPKSHASVNWHVRLHARRSRGWPRARRASPPPVPRRCRGH
jgi:hypothetical protein